MYSCVYMFNDGEPAKIVLLRLLHPMLNPKTRTNRQNRLGSRE